MVRFAALVVQCTILGLTLRVYVKGTMSAVPLVRLMARDGTLTFFVITCVCDVLFSIKIITTLLVFEIIVAIYALFRIEYAITAYEYAFRSFPKPYSLISFILAGC